MGRHVPCVEREGKRERGKEGKRGERGEREGGGRRENVIEGRKVLN